MGDICKNARVTVVENGARSVMGHILSAAFSRKLSSVGTLLLCKICLSLLGMVWHYQKIDSNDQICYNRKSLFLLWKSKLSEENKTLFCDYLNKLIVCSTTV